MQDRLKTLEENHQRSMDELQSSHRLKDTTNGARRSGFSVDMALLLPPLHSKKEQREKPQD